MQTHQYMQTHTIHEYYLSIGTMALDEIIVHTISHLEVSGVLESHCNDILKEG